MKGESPALTHLVYIILIETNFETANSMKMSFVKKTIDQIRFLIKEIFSLERFFTTTLKVYNE